MTEDAATTHDGIQSLLDIMRQLRDPDSGCPWDLKQNFHTIVPYTIEETYELAEAIAIEDFAQIRDELGDVLFQVVFYAQMASEQALFTFEDVVDGIAEKLLRRHPHVFAVTGGQRVSESEVKRRWEQIKVEERQQKNQRGTLDDVPMALPALSRSQKLQKRAANVGFDWPELEAVVEKLHEETGELLAQWQEDKTDKNKLKEEIGDILFVAANLARKAGVDPETALIETNRKFERRFHYIENALAEQNIPIEEAGLEKMDSLWDAAKKEEKK